MIQEHGEMFDTIGKYEKHTLVITTNSYIRTDGALVMGRGAAKQAAEIWPSLPFELGKRIEHLGLYGIVQAFPFIIAFQVKQHYHDHAAPMLIIYSTMLLKTLAKSMPDWRFDLNMPGIGNGHLPITTVHPVVEELPDNVHVWTFK